MYRKSLLFVAATIMIASPAIFPVEASLAKHRLPAGSWMLSCTNASMKGSVLRATCGKINGTQAKSAVNMAECDRGSTVSNIDGHLACDSGEIAQMPNGSWAKSCKDWGMKGPLLRATCGKIDGTWVASTLDSRECVGTVSNIDGKLKCD
jgi:hypothetical protein